MAKRKTTRLSTPVEPDRPTYHRCTVSAPKRVGLTDFRPGQVYEVTSAVLEKLGDVATEVTPAHG